MEQKCVCMCCYALLPELCVCVYVCMCVCLPCLSVHGCLLSDFVSFIYFPSSVFTSQSDIHPAHVYADLNRHISCVWVSVCVCVVVCDRVYLHLRLQVWMYVWVGVCVHVGFFMYVLKSVIVCARVCVCVCTAAQCSQ